MKYLEVVNLEKFQHYSDRPNVWIKWYKKSLGDYKFRQLTDAERWLFVGVIMLATEDGAGWNNVPFDALHIRNSVCYVGGKGVSKVRAGLLKMVKLGLLRVRNAIIDKSREDKRREEGFNKTKDFVYPYKNGKQLIKEKLANK